MGPLLQGMQRGGDKYRSCLMCWFYTFQEIRFSINEGSKKRGKQRSYNQFLTIVTQIRDNSLVTEYCSLTQSDCHPTLGIKLVTSPAQSNNNGDELYLLPNKIHLLLQITRINQLINPKLNEIKFNTFIRKSHIIPIRNGMCNQ